MKQLQLIAYGAQGVSEQKEKVFTIVDLESLSASVLYTEGENDVKRDGTIETVLPKFIWNDTLKVYINPLTGKTVAGYQNAEEKHSEYAKSGRTVILNPGSSS